MRRDGRIAFVMPYASMTRRSYRPFRKGAFKVAGYTECQICFAAAWVYGANVFPLFPVPSCVLFAERSAVPKPLPKTVLLFEGHLARRDASVTEADSALTKTTGAWPSDVVPSGSVYRKAFRAGAKLDPRRLVLVERVDAGRLGRNPAAPLVRGRVGSLDKAPWKNVEPPQGAVEAEFLRPVYLGESIAPYRLFEPVLAVIPWDEDAKELLTSHGAKQRGYTRLSNWLSNAEDIWKQFGKGRTTFADKIDFYGLLSIQFPIRSPRIVYSKSGMNPAAAIVRDEKAIIDHMLYWMPTASIEEAAYLTAIINSESTRNLAERFQSQGQWGARHFDKVIFNLPIPKFDSKQVLHHDLAKAANHAEKIAVAAPLEESEHFTRARRRVREALRTDGIADEIDKLVARLLK